MNANATTTYVVANYKGGTAKTTTAGLLSHALPADLCIDADPPGSLLKWSELGGWDLPVIGMPVADIHERLPRFFADSAARGGGFHTVIVDTPPSDDMAGIVNSSLRAADVVIVPFMPTTMELDRLSPIFKTIGEVAPLRAHPATIRVMLNRSDGRTKAGRNAIEVLIDAGFPVLPTVIPWKPARYGQAFGKPVHLGAGDPFQLAADDLKTGRYLTRDETTGQIVVRIPADWGATS